ncbi:hypothetical protein [Desulfosarcina variabilis]|uniref:hypothetical protein n=1 Tax=Desulfosarcina variabilis TaxID=2300 RepID=UPI003AFB4B7D
MIQNKLILYCTRLEQAMLWEVCKKRRCSTSNCLFKKIVKNFGENLWSQSPMRISTITAVNDNLEVLTQPLKIIRTPVIDNRLPKNQAISTIEQVTDNKIKNPNPITRTPVRTPISSISDLLREEIIETARQLK